MVIDFTGGAAANKALQEKLQKIQDLQNTGNRFQYPTDYSREWDNLLGFKWKDISFPVNDVSFELTHDLVEHKFPHVDGAYIETMGRNPLVISAQCLFFNTIQPAKNEDWIRGTLYPDVYSSFVRSMSNAIEVGDLIHPYFGALRCKSKSFKTVMNGNRRDGEVVEAQWLTTIEPDKSTEIVQGNAFISAAESAAEVDSLQPLPSELELDSGTSFSDFMNSIQGIVDSIAFTGNQFENALNEPLNKINKLLDSIERLNDSSFSNIEQIVRKHKANLLELSIRAGNIAASKISGGLIRKVSTIKIQQNMTITEVAQIPIISSNDNSLLQLITLNTRLIKKGTIAKGSEVKYFSGEPISASDLRSI